MSINNNFLNSFKPQTQAEKAVLKQSPESSDNAKLSGDQQLVIQTNSNIQQNANIAENDLWQFISANGVANNVQVNGNSLATGATSKKNTSDGGYIRTITSGKTTTTEKFNSKNLMVEYSFKNPNGVSNEWKHNDKGQETYYKTTTAKGIVTYEKKSLSSSKALQYYAVRRNANGKLTSSIMTNSKGVIVGYVAYASNQITLRYGNTTAVINDLASVLKSGKEVTSDIMTKLNEYANKLTCGKIPTKAQKESIKKQLNTLLNGASNKTTTTNTKATTSTTSTTKATTNTKATTSTTSTTKATTNTKATTSTTSTTKATTNTKATTSTTPAKTPALVKSKATGKIQDAAFAKSVAVIAKKITNTRLKSCFMNAMIFIDEASRKAPTTTATKDDSTLQINRNAAKTFMKYINTFCNSINVVFTAKTWCSGYYKNNKAYITTNIFKNKSDDVVSQLIVHELTHGMLQHTAGCNMYDESVTCLFESSYAAYAKDKESTKTVKSLCSSLRNNIFYRSTLPANLQIKKFCAA